MMNKRILGGSCLLVITMLGFAAVPGTKVLQGRYTISSASADPAPGDLPDSHFVVHLDGESAKSLYEAMKVAPRRTACGPDNLQHKIIGGMNCSFDPDNSTYGCGFALDIAKQRIDALAC